MIREEERKTAIEYIENQIRDGYVDLNFMDKVEMDVICCALKQYKHQRWIPCSERLPNETGKEYLVTAKYKDAQGNEIIRTTSDDYFSYGWDDYGEEVIAWAELPEPYKEEQE